MWCWSWLNCRHEIFFIKRPILVSCFVIVKHEFYEFDLILDKIESIGFFTLSICKSISNVSTSARMGSARSKFYLDKNGMLDSLTSREEKRSPVS